MLLGVGSNPAYIVRQSASLKCRNSVVAQIIKFACRRIQCTVRRRETHGRVDRLACACPADCYLVGVPSLVGAG